jgi:hypothetical protein
MYRLSNDFARHRFAVTVVGCGGTGGFAAESLCRLLPQNADLVLIDHDRVEERNLTRQNFCQQDLGRLKSQALAHRLAKRFDRPVGYSTLPIGLVGIKLPGLVLGCVDNGPARSAIARAIMAHPYERFWWVDAGNGENFGQVLIGNIATASACLPEDGVYDYLPLPTVQKPELLSQAPLARGCAEIAGEQGPTINLTMATVLVEVTRRLIAGTCPWVQLYIDMEMGKVTPIFATPETVRSLAKKKGGAP